MKEPRYGNWISSKLVAASLAAAFALLIGARLAVGHSRLLVGVLLAATLIAMAAAMYLLRCRTALSYEGGGVQGRVLDSVLDALDGAGWDGRGRLLDIGCGSGAMSVRAAKRYPRALVTGLDSWGGGWEYSQRQCEENARSEGVAGRISFRRGDAAKLPFLDGTFDAAVSNFVFHEVRAQRDKRALILEALRTVKPDGVFAFQDVFFSRRIYGDADALIEALRPHVQEIHLADTRRPDYAPAFLNTPLVLGRMGLIWGRK